MNDQENNVKYDETWLHRYQQSKLSTEELEEYELYLLDNIDDVVELEIEDSITDALSFERMKDKYLQIRERNREVKNKLIVTSLGTMAACVLIALMGWFIFTGHEVIKPGSGQLVYLENYRSSNTAEVTEVIAKAGEPLILVFSDLKAQERYFFELREEDSNELVSGLELTSSEDGEISYVIPAGKAKNTGFVVTVSNSQEDKDKRILVSITGI